MARRHEDRGKSRITRSTRSTRGPGPGPGPGPGKPGPRKPIRTGQRRRKGITVEVLPGKVADDGKVRLNRYLAMSGVASRRAADEVIAGGRVEVNGTVVTELGTRIDPQRDEVRVDGSRVQQEKKVYVLLNKPKGVVCTNARHEQKKRVIDLMPQVRGRIYTVGRLDLDSEGLIILTNDGDFALQMTHPRFGVPKQYAVTVRGRVGRQQIDKARSGVWLAEGPTAGMEVRIEHSNDERTFLKVRIREGRNREIRRVFAKLGFPVKDLKRIRIGDLSLHGLKESEWRFLRPDEINGLLAAAREGGGNDE